MLLYIDIYSYLFKLTVDFFVEIALLVIRALFFNLIIWIYTFFVAAIIVLLRPLGLDFVYSIAMFWSRSSLYMLELICGVKCEVVIKGDLPEGPAVYLSNHQSALETIAFPSFLPQFVWVLKRELFYIPIFGWCMKALGQIGIDRSAGGKAVKLMNKEGKMALGQGRSVAIFPEGTRVPHGKMGAFSPGGAGLAINCGIPVVPVAHNAGKVWKRRSFRKAPGVVTFIIDEPIPTAGMPASERKKLSARVREIIAERLEELESV